jgi:hypothetical protein
VLSTPPAFILSQDETLRGRCHRRCHLRFSERPDLAGPVDPPAPGKETGAVWIRMSPSVWPVDWPSRRDGVNLWIRIESLLACHSIRFSRFRRSGTIRYVSVPPLSTATSDRFSDPRATDVSGHRTAPDREPGAPGRHWRADVQRIQQPLSDGPRSVSSYQPALRLRTHGRSG